MADNYTKREIDLQLANLMEKLDNYHTLQMTELRFIKEQTTKTNGRVTKHDERIENLDDGIKENRAEIRRWLTVGAVVVAIVEFTFKFLI